MPPQARAAGHGPGFTCGVPVSTGTSGVYNVLRGGGGWDDLCGGAIREWLRGFGGRDHLAGGNATDKLEGGSGGDWFYSAEGEKDFLYGGTLSSSGHVDSSSLDTAWCDKSIDFRRGINKVNP
jgi:Ca2+-binding RTX toxin-like protein